MEPVVLPYRGEGCLMVMPLYPIPPPPLPSQYLSVHELLPDCKWLPKPEVVEDERKPLVVLFVDAPVSFASTCILLPEPPPPPPAEVYRR